MYWPVGIPKAYALSNHASTLRSSRVSQDGLHDQKREDDKIIELPGDDASNSASTGGKSAKSQTSARTEGTNGSDRHSRQGTEASDNVILAAKASRNSQIVASITRDAVTIWQAKPFVAITAVTRSARSMQTYGCNNELLIKPDGAIVVLQTELGYLITYNLVPDPQALVYRTSLPESSRHARRSSTTDGFTKFTAPIDYYAGTGAGPGGDVREASLRFRMVIRIDAGISKALALDDALLIATKQPAALQSIRWSNEEGTPQTSTELLERLSWYTSNGPLVDMVHDRPMNLLCWVAGDGKAYAVQRRQKATGDAYLPRALFQGFCFREGQGNVGAATKAAINARFSLIAVGISTGHIEVYIVKDYSGNIPLSHHHQISFAASTTGALVNLSYSPDGHCLFVGYEKGWATWSVYGTALASSFAADVKLTKTNQERWLLGVKNAFWLAGGCEMAITTPGDDRVWVVEYARGAGAGCLSPPNLSRGLLHTGNSITMYKGHSISDLTAMPSDASLLETIQVSERYSAAQWPIKTAVISPDSKYVAVAGSRGLAHYSVLSGRWKTFGDSITEDQFSVRGGMCWHQHFLIAAVEVGNRYVLQVYSREKSLGRPVCEEKLAAPAVLLTMSGNDSLLVYTYDNILLHYSILPSGSGVKLVQVGQIGFHGIIRAPLRVRAISWILPESQLEHGDPSQDVATATVLFLVDGKLVLLQPSSNERGELKYDMRVIAQNVEYFILQRDQAGALTVPDLDRETSSSELGSPLGHSLRDSLWYFDGNSYNVWSDVHDVLACAPNELGRDLPATVRVPVDFYPVSARINKGIVHGLDTELVQRRDVNFSYFRHNTRTQLFLPGLLRHHLSEYNSPAALHLASSYQHLPYFAHALEILLHDVLDSEVDAPPSPPETALLPTVVSFLSSFPAYLDVIVNCTRKTELRSWRTLFACLPPVQQLFEQSLELRKLKTAAGYLLVLHALEQEQDGFQVQEFARLLARAASEQEWDLCGELARFLVGIDGSGKTLRSVLARSGLAQAPNGSITPSFAGHADGGQSRGSLVGLLDQQAAPQHGDYFSLGLGG
ncbi:hypothetical protein LTR62_002063 [Meristemomyces frigidus]|uniref:RIC1 C-terminal alpha solenoid region domain-containing protein n=1 Tax=Meristemomyces frigidus TaxID=1508187 RepID=A0AAN7YQD6_9PEZI|nr:hypothetical protein LTR62_002063 [Meristemomyces frigidus]